MVTDVLQDDVHIPNLTVEETLNYAAWTRLDDTVSVIDRKERVADILKKLELTQHKDKYVGDAILKGISGGQKKRLSLAVEIIAKPKFIFLDGECLPQHLSVHTHRGCLHSSIL